MIRKENRIFVGIVLFLIFALFCSLVGGKIFTAKISAMKNAQKRSESSSAVNWKERYPYSTVVEEVKVEKTVSADNSAVKKYTGKISKLSTLGNDWSKLLYGYDTVSQIGYILNSRLTDPALGNMYIRLKNGSWITASSEITFDSAKKAVAPYASLKNYLNEKGIGFLYFYAPHKDCDIDHQYPEGITSYVNANVDKYLRAMDAYGIDYVDFREELHRVGRDHYASFYVTDHHWTVETGLWAASVVAKRISDTFGLELADPCSLGEYHGVLYPKAEFGSIGTGVTHFVAQPEDFTMLYPDFETSYRLEIPNKNIDVTGAFEELFFDTDAVQELIENGGGSAYGKILYGNQPYEKITNLKNPNGPKIFMIRDSFSIAAAPYLAASCSELVMIDTRPGTGNFTGSIINCIEQEQPDIVISLQYTPQAIRIN